MKNIVFLEIFKTLNGLPFSVFTSFVNGLSHVETLYLVS